MSSLDSSLRKRTIIDCFLVGQTLSMSMEKQYTLGKYTVYPVFGSAPLELFYISYYINQLPLPGFCD